MQKIFNLEREEMESKILCRLNQIRLLEVDLLQRQSELDERLKRVQMEESKLSLKIRWGDHDVALETLIKENKELT